MKEKSKGMSTMKNHNNYQIEIENYLTIDHHTLSLNPGIEGFVGKNAQGKTNILKAVQALVDRKSDPSKIRDGAKKFVVRFSISDQEGNPIAMVARVQTKDGVSFAQKGLPKGETPVKFLARFFDEKMLNPIKLIEDDPVSYLKRHLNVELTDDDIGDYAKLDHENAFEYAERVAETVAEERLIKGREHKNSVGALEDLKVGTPETASPCPYDPEALAQELAKLHERKGSIEAIRAEKEAKAEDLKTAAEGLNRLGKSIANNRNRIEQLRSQILQIEARIEVEEDTLAQDRETFALKEEQFNQIEVPSVESIEKGVEEVRQKQQAVRDWEQTSRRIEAVEKKAKQVEELAAEYKNLDEKAKFYRYELPKRLIERAALPVDGLEFRDGKLYVNDRRIDLLSNTERATVAVKLAAALAKQRGQVALSLDGVEMMDREHRDEFLSIAKKSGLKIFYTRVGPPEGEHEFEVINGKVN